MARLSCNETFTIRTVEVWRVGQKPESDKLVKAKKCDHFVGLFLLDLT
jgi:hypothetical protein